MKGGLAIDEPSGPRWALALNLLAEGREFVIVGTMQLARQSGWSGADGMVHAAVLTTDPSMPRVVAQQQVDAARKWLGDVIQRDARLAAIVDQFGVVWELAADDGSATWLIATADECGVLQWPER